ncbi:glucose-1-phosphate thymidylyltransferase [Verrucomicrobiia bacterium DG1235]|nr:glucose-1-phosphate thymidylyltransferase [Verrucomicrobiae bacterium DG1235]
MPIYDKPMIYYPVSLLMLAGIKDILIISTPQDTPLFERLLGDGSAFGVNFSYEVQPSPDGLAQAFLIGEEFLDGAPAALVLGDNLFYGHELVRTLKSADSRREGATIFGYNVADPTAYGVVEFSPDGKVLSIEEKPENPKSNYAVPGLYFYDERVVEFAKQIKPSPRGELEITDLNRVYLENGDLSVELLGRGTAWLDTGTHKNLMEAGQFVQVIEERQGLKMACLEGIGFENGWLKRSQLEERIQFLGKTTYATYLRKMLK